MTKQKVRRNFKNTSQEIVNVARHANSHRDRRLVATDQWCRQHPAPDDVLPREAGHEILLVTPNLFHSVPCPTYPEIRLALFPYRGVSNLISGFHPDAIHIATEGSLGFAARRYCLRHGLKFTTS